MAHKRNIYKNKANGISGKVTVYKSGANKSGPEQLNIEYVFLFLMGVVFFQIEIRQIKYLNNIIEQDHRGIKRIVSSMMGFKSFQHR